MIGTTMAHEACHDWTTMAVQMISHKCLCLGQPSHSPVRWQSAIIPLQLCTACQTGTMIVKEPCQARQQLVVAHHQHAQPTTEANAVPAAGRACHSVTRCVTISCLKGRDNPSTDTRWTGSCYQPIFQLRLSNNNALDQLHSTNIHTYVM